MLNWSRHNSTNAQAWRDGENGDKRAEHPSRIGSYVILQISSSHTGEPVPKGRRSAKPGALSLNARCEAKHAKLCWVDRGGHPHRWLLRCGSCCMGVAREHREAASHSRAGNREARASAVTLKKPGWERSASRFTHRAPRCVINQGCQVGSRAASDPASARCRTVTSWRHIRSSRRCDGEFQRQQRRGAIAARGATRSDVARRSASASVAVWPLRDYRRYPVP